MNPQSLGAVAGFLAVLLWLVSRRRPAPLTTFDTSGVAAINRAQISLMQEAAAATQNQNQELVGSTSFQVPVGARQRQLVLRTLLDQITGDDAERLLAMRAARAWAHRDTLPLLSRGLRDVNPEVVLEASRAMEAFRGRSTVSSAAHPQMRLPRNAARTR